jgi:hypothetical protein
MNCRSCDSHTLPREAHLYSFSNHDASATALFSFKIGSVEAWANPAVFEKFSPVRQTYLLIDSRSRRFSTGH